MYDTEEEIKRKRKNLIKIILIVVFFIVLLIVFLLIRKNLFKNNNKTSNNISCELEVLDNVLPNDSGIYNQNITVGFKEVSSEEGYEIVSKKIGTSNSPKNKETYEIKRSGEYVLYGYLEDSKGNTGECEIKVTVSTTKPTCELEVTKGTMGENSWYKDNIQVTFKEKNTNNPTLEIKKYYIIKSNEQEPSTSNNSYEVVENGNIELNGYVIDTAGSVGTCSIAVKKDSTPPACTLVVTSGTKNSTGGYTDNPTIGFGTTTDDVSIVVEKGIGTSKNYEKQSYTISEVGTHTIKGYVKDEAGNEGVCSITVKKVKKESKPTQPVDDGSKTQCIISVCHPTVLIGGAFPAPVKVMLKYTVRNGTTAKKYTLKANDVYLDNVLNWNELNNDGKYKIEGFIEDSFGGSAKCEYSFEIKTYQNYESKYTCE